MYFFIHGGGGLPKNYSDEGGGACEKNRKLGGSYNFQITLLQIPPATPYPLLAVEHQNRANSPKTLQNGLRREQTTKNTTKQ